jgi:hypothetical protein
VDIIIGKGFGITMTEVEENFTKTEGITTVMPMSMVTMVSMSTDMQKINMSKLLQYEKNNFNSILAYGISYARLCCVCEG